MESVARIGTAASVSIARLASPLGSLGLSVGQTLHARVTRVEGDTVQLQWGDRAVAVGSRVPLSVGQQVSLMVEEGAGGKMLLRMVDETFGKGRQGQVGSGSQGASNGSGVSGASSETNGSGLPGASTQATGAGSTAPTAGRPGPNAAPPGRPGAPGSAPDQSGTPAGTFGRFGPAASVPGWGAVADDGVGASLAFWGTQGDPDGVTGAPRQGAGQAAAQSGQVAGQPGQTAAQSGQTAAQPGQLAQPGQPAAQPGQPPGLPARPSATVAGQPSGTAPSQRPLPNGALPRGMSLPFILAGAAQDASQVLLAGLPLVAPTVEGDPLTTLLFEPVDSAPSRPPAAPRSHGAESAPQGTTTSPPGNGVVPRSAMPTYGKLAQSVGGAAAFGQLMATLGHEAGQTLARAPLAPADLGRLLVDVGLHPDETNAALVSEMLAQGVAVSEASVRRLRRGLAAAGGTVRDTAPTVALGRLGLPVTPLTLAVARQVQAGQLDPKAAWGELLGELQLLAGGAGGSSQASVLAAELLADWRVPVEDGADGIARWLRAAVDRAATPLEAKLTRALVQPDADRHAATSPGQDVRARLDMMAQILPPSSRADRNALTQAIQRTQATIQAEQILNGATTERTEPRFFAMTLPTFMHHQPSTLELRVRERDAQPRRPGDVVQPDVVQLKLSLPGLGDLGVNLMVGQHSVACHFSAGSAFSEMLLNATSGELVSRFRQLGFAHTAVDAAHEQLPAVAPLSTAPRVNNRVDTKA